MKRTHPAPVCPYCGRVSILVPDEDVYSRSYGGKVWICRHCQAWVGTHKNSPNHVPLGRLAKAELRLMKIDAHALFDRLWKAAMRHRGWSKSQARRAAYRWLANEMNLSAAECHIGMFDEAQTAHVLQICKQVLNDVRKKRSTETESVHQVQRP
jgi:ribosomal protein L37AE/L43A